MRVPSRQSLVAQSMQILLEGIRSGEWRDYLPGELELCSRMLVSRATLRAALAELERDGYLVASQGKRREIVGGRPRQRIRQPRHLRRVALLSPMPQTQLDTVKLLWIEILRKQLATRGLDFEFLACSAAGRPRPARVLEDLTHRHPDTAWILLRSTAPMRRWFVENHVPALAAGSRYSDADLPCVDVDYHAACRHAAGTLIARGCERLAVLTPSAMLAGDHDSEAGFREGAGTRSVGAARHDGTRESLCRALDSLMAGRPPPQGILVFHSAHAVTALGHLIRSGWQIPAQVKLISRDDDPIMDHVVPSPARYSISPVVYARQIFRVIARFLSNEPPLPSPRMLMPRFIAGESTHQAPKN